MSRYGPRPTPPAERFVRLIDFDGPEECWLWTGHVGRLGYAKFAVSSRHSVWAHRFGYELLVGPIPEGLQLDHLCRVRHCVRPSHLEPVTARENMLRSPLALPAINARKTQCIDGHPYDEVNTYTDKRGCRHCRACARRRRREFQARAS